MEGANIKKLWKKDKPPSPRQQAGISPPGGRESCLHAVVFSP